MPQISQRTLSIGELSDLKRRQADYQNQLNGIKKPSKYSPKIRILDPLPREGV